MWANNVVSLMAVREIKKAEKAAELEYRARILGMDKLDLLQEMMHFQEERSKIGKLTIEMMIQGQILFQALEDTAETTELKDLTRSYRKHLKLELKATLEAAKG